MPHLAKRGGLDPSFPGQTFVFTDQRAECIIAHLTGAGYARIEPPILQPASIFFDSARICAPALSHQRSLRRDYCLRPEYTIPVLSAYLATASAGARAAFCYCGPVFRFRPGQDSDFTQAGIENSAARTLRRRMRKSSPSRSMPPLAVVRNSTPASRLFRADRRLPGYFPGFSKRWSSRPNGAAASRAATVKANPST